MTDYKSYKSLNMPDDKIYLIDKKSQIKQCGGENEKDEKGETVKKEKISYKIIEDTINLTFPKRIIEDLPTKEADLSYEP